MQREGRRENKQSLRRKTHGWDDSQQHLSQCGITHHARNANLRNLGGLARAWAISSKKLRLALPFPLCCDEFAMSAFFVTSSLGQDSSVHIGIIWEEHHKKNALLRVMSTVSCAPSTWTFMSHNLTLRLAVAPASRQTGTKEISATFAFVPSSAGFV